VVERLALLAGLVLAAVIAVYLVRRWVAARAVARAGLALPDDLQLQHPGAPTVVYFYGAGCPTCPTQRAALETLTAERAPLNIVPVDAAADPRLAEWAGVLTVPSTALVDPGGHLQHVNHGFRSAAELADQLTLIA
jgi:thioredoxin-like negative regulator of GroEL